MQECRATPSSYSLLPLFCPPHLFLFVSIFHFLYSISPQSPHKIISKSADTTLSHLPLCSLSYICLLVPAAGCGPFFAGSSISRFLTVLLFHAHLPLSLHSYYSFWHTNTRMWLGLAVSIGTTH